MRPRANYPWVPFLGALDVAGHACISAHTRHKSDMISKILDRSQHSSVGNDPSKNPLLRWGAARESAVVDLGDAVRQWRTDGFVILPGFIPAAELKPALDELPAMYPTADGFHDGTDERRVRFTVDEWAGIDHFPFRSTELSLLAVSDRVIGLAEALLADGDAGGDGDGDGDLRIYSAEAWAKYTGAADYDQPLHRDYLNHTLVVPSGDPRFWQLEMFVYLVDVPEELGPPSMVSRTRTTGLPAKPNWYPRDGGADAEGGWVETAGRPDLYAAEVRAAGPTGTIVAWTPGTFHRGTALTLPRGARYTIHVGYRPARAEWGQRTGWVGRSHEPEWYDFAHRATPRQLALFGFPPPGHPYWTEATLAGTALRYPGLDLTPWRRAPRAEA
jgi:Phytanoyl-CoA dioxygenase (PhyH)